MSQLKIKDGNSWVNIPASGIGIPSGGSAGQYLKKSSSTDYATEWANMPQTTILSPSVTRSSGASEVDEVSAVRYGNIVQLSISLHATGSTNAGSNIFEGSLSGIPLPAVGTSGSGYYGTSTLTGSIETDGTITIRVTAANRASSSNVASVRWTYICN